MMDLNHLDQLHRDDLKQKSRVKWTIEEMKILDSSIPSSRIRIQDGNRSSSKGPLSPLLFLLADKALQISILEACNKGLYKGISLVSGGANISLLQYADDALFFGNWSRVYAYNLILILKCFEEASGLKVKIAKSRLFRIRVSNIKVECVASSLGCTHNILPFMYLGLPVGISMRFFWVKWNIILLDPSLKRLGVGSLYTKNLGLLDDGGFSSPSSSFGNMGVWCNILKEIEGIEASVPLLKNSFRLKVCNGLNVSFWKDPWCGDRSRLIDVFYRLFALESHQDCKVNKRWCRVDGVWGGNWEWRLPPRGRALNVLNSLLNVIGNLALSPNCVDK
ncbi:hypothetical protein Tco_0093760 [Tanacetum coccineum]